MGKRLANHSAVVSCNRREFLRRSAIIAGISTAGNVSAPSRGVSVVADPGNAITRAEPVQWALAELNSALDSKKIPVRMFSSIEQAPHGDVCILIEQVPAHAPETVVLKPDRLHNRGVLKVAGSDVRGVVYGVTELADRARHGVDPVAALLIPDPITEAPANRIRSVARCFTSDVEDKLWYHDRAMWKDYLTMLATQRFNRFNITFGLQYNYPMRVTESYLYFTYPFLIEVPGYDVRARGLPDSERDQNLKTLQFIGEETVKRGLQFHVGLWTHAYLMPPNSEPSYPIDGLTRDNHAAYCRDALRRLLSEVPQISGITFRIHGESGIPEGAYDFWTTVFEGIVSTGRTIEIDMHAKGMDFKMIDVALATGMPVTLSPKYWAEHMGLGYHQAAIRDLEMPPRDAKAGGLFTFSNGSRKFLRYGYGDLYREDRRYGILYRIWPGTQRALLWGDPALAASYGRTANLCGADGVEWCEPLSFKGRMGSGNPGGRCGYADLSLNPKYDWQKFEYTYRVWGRLTYNPSARPDGWRRHLAAHFPSAAAPVEAALSSASRILPLITTAHAPSASNNAYWPEMYTNMPIVDAGRKHPYGDTPAPKLFGNVSSLDPQLFLSIHDHATDLLQGISNGKYSPVEVAQRLDELGLVAARYWADAEKRAGADRQKPEFRRMAADVAIQSGLARFFAAKMRSAVLWEIYERTGHRTAGEEALKSYRKARQNWAELAVLATPVYVADVSYGPQKHLRGHWSDRLPDIDADIADMQQKLQAGSKPADQSQTGQAQEAIRRTLLPPRRPAIRVHHVPPNDFRPGEPLRIQLSLDHGPGWIGRCHYRHVNQAEQWMSVAMDWRDNEYHVVIPGEYTKSVYPLQYYFELRDKSGVTALYPDLGPELSSQPYFVVRVSGMHKALLVC